jgi:transcriptional regulator with XRE-family HTH domain
MAKWRALTDYTPFARLLVEHMWSARPPLLPNQFAEQMGVRKQALSTWLNSDAVPAPQVVVRLARGMNRPVRELMTAAGYASENDPLLDKADAWAYVRGEAERVARAEEEVQSAETSGLPSVTPDAWEMLLTLLQVLQERTLARAPLAADAADAADDVGDESTTDTSEEEQDRPGSR